MTVPLTFFATGSWTEPTRRPSSLRIALAATPVVAVLKSMWDAPRTRTLVDSLGIREDMVLEGEEGERFV